jgi:hypothetical protein
MAEDRWISVADAADFFETPDAERLINQAWKLGTGRFRGVRPGENETVEIPSSEHGKINCAASRVVDGLFTTHLSVVMRWADAKPLAPASIEAEENTAPASSPPHREPQSAASAPAAEEPLAEADVKRLAQTDANRLLAEETQTPSAREGASNADILEAEVGPVVKAVAVELRRIFPKGRPALRVDELMVRVKDAAGENLGVFSGRTLERAVALAWAKAGKARQA